MVESLKFGETGRNKLKYPNKIEEKKWNKFFKEGRKKRANTSDAKEVVSLGW